MDPPNRSGVKNRQADGGCCRRSPFLRAEQRNCATAKTRIRDRAVVAVLHVSFGVTPRRSFADSGSLRPRDVLGRPEKRALPRFAIGASTEQLWRSNPLYQPGVIHLVFKIMKSFITISLSLLCTFAVLAQPQPSPENNPPPIDPSNFDTSVKPSGRFLSLCQRRLDQPH